jgi:hypothetical protein
MPLYKGEGGDMLSKKRILSIFTIVITFTAICLNFSEFLMGNMATGLNLIVSISFLLLWAIFSFYSGIQRDTKYLRFILVYWGINIVSFVAIWIVGLTNSSAMFLLPFSIWYGAPLYGFDYILNSGVSVLILVTAPLGLVFSVIGYKIGLASLLQK